MEETRMEREERVITNAFVNFLAPLIGLALMANFIPYLMIIVPVEESDMCWFYFLTKSPYQLPNIPNWLYWSSKIFYYISTCAEILVLVYYTKKI